MRLLRVRAGLLGVAAAALLSACGGKMYYNPGNPGADFGRDSAYCEEHALVNGPESGGFGGAGLREAAAGFARELGAASMRSRMYELCLRQRGWIEAPDDPAALAPNADEIKRNESFVKCLKQRAPELAESNLSYEELRDRLEDACRAATGGCVKGMAAYYARQALDAKSSQ